MHFFKKSLGQIRGCFYSLFPPSVISFLLSLQLSWLKTEDHRVSYPLRNLAKYICKSMQSGNFYRLSIQCKMDSLSWKFPWWHQVHKPVIYWLFVAHSADHTATCRDTSTISNRCKWHCLSHLQKPSQILRNRKSEVCRWLSILSIKLWHLTPSPPQNFQIMTFYGRKGWSFLLLHNATPSSNMYWPR